VPCALGTITRTVWDGQRELWEIRMPSWDSLHDSAFWENDTAAVAFNYYADGAQTAYYFDNLPVFGRVGYTHGAALDQPLSISRFAYRDRWYEQGVNNPYTWAPFTVVPHWNWRGQSDYGLFADGECMQCQSGANARCIKTRWRHRAFAFALEANALADSLFHTYAWLGSLVGDKENGTGTVYRRNRYLDPLTGQFTQEDPAGLSGGPNLYGFAGGDPVNFGDPFGLDVTGNAEAMRAYQSAKEQMAVCALSGVPGFNGPCGGSQAADAVKGLSFLDRLEGDHSITVRVEVVDGGSVTVDQSGSGLIQVGRGFDGLGLGAYTMEGLVAHEVYEEGMYQFQGATRSGNPSFYGWAHTAAVRYAEDPTYAGAGVQTRTSRSKNCDVFPRPNPFGSAPVCFK
jgi:RHS repeat-associated protein